MRAWIRAQQKGLRAAGYPVQAIDKRGYGSTDIYTALKYQRWMTTV